MPFFVPYLNKLMDEINLGVMLYSKKLRSTLPVKLKYTDSIVVSYKFSNKVLREFSNEYSNTLVCDCKQNPDLAPFIYNDMGMSMQVTLTSLSILDCEKLCKKVPDLEKSHLSVVYIYR